MCVFFILTATCAEITIVMIYFQVRGAVVLGVDKGSGVREGIGPIMMDGWMGGGAGEIESDGMGSVGVHGPHTRNLTTPNQPTQRSHPKPSVVPAALQ